MTLEEGKVVKKFLSRDGRDIVFRGPRISDVGMFMEFINGLINESNIMIGKTKTVTREEELIWLERILESIRENRLEMLVAEANNRIVGEVELRIGKDVNSHVANLGLALATDYRHVGLGIEMMRTIFQMAAVRGIRLITLKVFATNEYAIRAYENIGFRAFGRLPNGVCKNGGYIDEVYMFKAL